MIEAGLGPGPGPVGEFEPGRREGRGQASAGSRVPASLEEVALKCAPCDARGSTVGDGGGAVREPLVAEPGTRDEGQEAEPDGQPSPPSTRGRVVGEGLKQGFHGRPALARVRGQAALEDAPQPARELGRWGLDRPRTHGVEQGDRRAPSERPAAAQGLPKRDTEAELIRGGGGGLATILLGGHIGGGPHQRARGREIQG